MHDEIPTKLADKLGDARMTEALTQAGRWVDGKGHVLVLEGGTGSGKSLAAAWAFEFVRHRLGLASALWCYVPEVAAIAEWKGAEWARFDRARLLVLDDLGTERTTNADRAAAVLERVWNTAAGRCIVTTNVSRDQVSALYGARATSRLASATWATIPTGDMRVTPPAGRAAPSPSALTKSERAAAKAAEEAREREEQEEARELEERREMAARAQAELRRLTAAKDADDIEALEAGDEQRRRELAEQVEQLKQRASAEVANG